MSNAAAVAAALTAALEAEAAREAGGDCVLVSVNIALLAAPVAGVAKAQVERKTKTLAFLSANYIGADGAVIASASSVHRIGG